MKKIYKVEEVIYDYSEYGTTIESQLIRVYEDKGKALKFAQKEADKAQIKMVDYSKEPHFQYLKTIEEKMINHFLVSEIDLH